LKGIKNKEAYAAKERELQRILEKKDRQGITTKDLMYQMKISTATLYKHLKRNPNIEKISRGKWRLKPRPTPLLGSVDSDIIEQLFSREGLVPCTIFEGENPKIPFHGMFEDMLAGNPSGWHTKQKENWVEDVVSQTYGQPKLLVFFPKHFAGLTYADLDEELFFANLPGFCNGMLYRMIEWNARAKKLKLNVPNNTNQRMNWLQQALDFDFLFVVRVDGRKIAAQLKQQVDSSKPV